MVELWISALARLSSRLPTISLMQPYLLGPKIADWVPIRKTAPKSTP